MIASLIVSLLTAAAPVATPAPGSKKDPSRVVCRTEEVTGSHLASERKCMTLAQWKEYDRLQRESVDQAQRVTPHS